MGSPSPTRPQRIESRIRPSKLTAIDLFSGCGGLTLGLKQAGFRVLAGVEADDLSVETYKANHPEVRVLHGDIREVDLAKLMSDLGLRSGMLDLLAGCPPCQGFSTLRTKNQTAAVNDPRNRLVKEFLRFARELLPRAIMLENVPGLAEYEVFGAVVAELEGLGFSCHSAVLDAANFGVPQRRRRLVLLGSRFGEVHFALRSTSHPTVRSAIGRLSNVGESGDPLHDVSDRRSQRVLKMIAKIPTDGGSRVALPEGMVLKCHRTFGGFRDVYGRMAWDGVAPTITTGCINPSKGRFLHPEHNRSITPREAALLQGFPGTYVFALTAGKYGAARLIGNAFPPQFARRLAARVAVHLASAPRDNGEYGCRR
jgi:DNA (cytosine-5)-methyltransferase 1